MIKAWFYDRNNCQDKVVPMTKFGIVKEMTAQCMWIHENKRLITEATTNVVPNGPTDSKWIGEFSHQSTVLWQEASNDPKTVEEYKEKEEQFREGRASLEVKAR